MNFDLKQFHVRLFLDQFAYISVCDLMQNKIQFNSIHSDWYYFYEDHIQKINLPNDR